MAAQSTPQQFVLLPSHSLRATAATPSAVRNVFLAMPHVGSPAGPATIAVPGAQQVTMRVIDSIHPDGAKLVELSPDAVLALRANAPGVRLVPIVYYYPALAPRPVVLAGPAGQGPGVPATPQAVLVAADVANAAVAQITVQVVSQADGNPVAGATVVAFTDFAARTGAQGTSDDNGNVRLALGAAHVPVERLYVYPKVGFWTVLRENLAITSGMQIQMTPLDLSFTDGLRFFYGNSPDTAGAGVTVGVIDTGIATNHPDLAVQGGENTVPGEDPTAFGDNGEGHGTHVAGIIAAKGTPPVGLRGLAPAVTLRSYRVFGQNSGQASNYAIAKAIDRAVGDGCDLINMSLGGGPPDDALKAAIEDARAQGTLVIVAAGNDHRSPVSFPASDPLSIAISALGRQGTFPDNATEEGDVAPPPGADSANFVAEFSNIGPEIVLIGPGVGILSTFPDGYAELSGTSMACPAVTGLAAKLLSGRADILGMARNEARRDAMAQALLQAGATLGFPPELEGHGLPGI